MKYQHLLAEARYIMRARDYDLLSAIQFISDHKQEYDSEVQQELIYFFERTDHELL